ncbi:MAG: chorismate synthase [Clostridia bacterium]|nr:chorismate synthase [Clostridia bacterium]
MSSVWGRNLKITVFGQSHAEAIGVVVDGLPAGLRIDTDELQAFLQRRAAGGAFATARKEPDVPEFVSGLVDGVTCGAPVTALIRNTNVRSGDYSDLRDHPRPSHADYPASVRFDGANDIRGGGQFSGRLTAALCVAGGLCRQFLKTKGITIGAHIASIGNIRDTAFDPVGVAAADFLTDLFPVRDEQAKAAMQELITAARSEGDSVGGTIECAAVGLPVGVGDPLFDGLENRISSIVFGIPAVKGIEFGNGFDAAELKGSENNDAYYFDGDTVKTRTNRHGGILGGISTGMPLVFRVAIKPTPSIAKEQETVELSSKSAYMLAIKGRHDPCIVPRAVPCVEAALAIALADYLV